MPDATAEWLSVALHDLCQPLTALECRLFLGLQSDDAVEMRLAMREAKVQCERLIDGVRGIQGRLE